MVTPAAAARLLWGRKQPDGNAPQIGHSSYISTLLKIGRTAQELAKASLSVCAVIDFEAILIDGAFPDEIKHELVERTRRYLVNQDLRGLIAPRIEAGMVGFNARAIGAATSPLFERYFMNGNLRLQG